MKPGRDWADWCKYETIFKERLYIIKSPDTGKPIPWSNKPWYAQSFTLKVWGVKEPK